MSDVHYQQPGFLTMPETDGHGDTCGIDAMLAYLHVTHGTLPESVPEVNTLRADFIRQGWFNQGMTINSIVDAMHNYFMVTALKMVPWGAVTQIALRSDLKDAATAKQCIILETHNAAALPDNQPGVQNHFVTVWGIDSNLGYWTANGDTLTALRSTTPVSPVWYTWAQIAAANIQAYAIFPAVQEAPVTIIVERDANGDITGAYDAADHAKKIGAGFAKDLADHNELEYTIVDGETYVTAHQSIATLTGPLGTTDQVKTYSQQFGVISYGGNDLQEIVHALLATHTATTVDIVRITAEVKDAQVSLENILHQLGA